MEQQNIYGARDVSYKFRFSRKNPKNYEAARATMQRIKVKKNLLLSFRIFYKRFYFK